MIISSCAGIHYKSALDLKRWNALFLSKGFTSLGVSKPLNIITQTKKKELHTFLKTASGFGGANTALLLKSIL